MTSPPRRGEAIAQRDFGPFTAEAVAAFAAASADTNPLHVDPALAAKAGLPRPPIHGMLIMGCFEDYVQGWRSGATVRKMSAKFIRPVLVDEGVEIAGKVVQVGHGGHPAVLRLTVKRRAADAPADIVCLGEVFVDP